MGRCSIIPVAAQKFQAIQEWDDRFLSLFPHRFDYIYAEHSEAGQTPDWQTESRYPLSDRVLRQGAYLYGVRFGSRTHYCLLDIDIGSVYHPQHDQLAIARIGAALEPLGLVAYLVCTSSYSGGIHLYFPFQEAQTSWELAIAISSLLENAGFKLKPGQLEIFPNPKPYSLEGQPSLFNAHRLPLQAGSYLLNSEFQPIWSDQHCFVEQWRLAQQRNDLSSTTLKQVVKQSRRKSYCVSGKADKFLNDLNAEIELGWTGSGQTNRLLGRIALRCYVFHHVLKGGEPLEGQALVNEIVTIARSLPGYREWCRHQHEIESRAAEWARCVENSRYFHYGSSKGKFKQKEDLDVDAASESNALTWNRQQSESARSRIQTAIADLLNKNELPAKTTDRFKALTKYGIGGGSLYRHRDLWHPDFLWKTPSDSPNALLDVQSDCACRASALNSSTSLLPENGGNAAPSLASSDRSAHFAIEPGNNFSSNDDESFQPNPEQDDRDPRLAGIEYVRHILLKVKADREANQRQIRDKSAIGSALMPSRSHKYDDYERKYQQRMQQFLASGDPILMAEAFSNRQNDCKRLPSDFPD